MAEVFLVIKGSIDSAVILPESRSTSAKIGLRLDEIRALEVAINYLDVVITSDKSGSRKDL